MGEEEATKRPATTEELIKMKELLAEGLAAGSIGLSTGLFTFIFSPDFFLIVVAGLWYPPNRPATTGKAQNEHD